MANLQLTDKTVSKRRILDKYRPVGIFLSILIVTFASCPVFASTIYGWIERIEMRGTSAAIIGWTCQPSLNQSINVAIHLGIAPPNGSLFWSMTANQSLDPEVSAVCKTSGVAHRYQISLTSAEIMTPAGKAAYAIGISGDC